MAAALCLLPACGLLFLLGTIGQKSLMILSGPLTFLLLFFTLAFVTLDELIQPLRLFSSFVFQGLNSLILYTSQVFFFLLRERERR